MKLTRAINFVLRLVDLQIIRSSTLDKLRDQHDRRYKPSYVKGTLPTEADRYLRPDNPRLRAIAEEYDGLGHPAADPSIWADRLADAVTLPYFRGDNPYVYQLRDGNLEINYLLTSYYLASLDALGLLDTLDEDGLFGAYVYPWQDGRLVSRDLLDSIAEIYFLEETLRVAHWDGLRVLDVGAGYGRMAHRLVRAIPRLARVFCVDAIPVSTFLCEYYLRFRGVGDKATVLTLGNLEDALRAEAVDLAMNVHSFSECTLRAVCWWLDFLKAHRVRYLFVVPNAGKHGGTQLLTRERDDTRRNFLPEILARGYQLRSRQPKYRDPSVQKYGVSPTYHYLFELVS